MKKIIWNSSLLLSSILFPIITIEIAYKFYRLTYKDSTAAINKNLSCNEPYIEKGNIQFLLDDTNSACRSWNQGKEKIWESQFKLENIGNDSLYNIYQDFCTE